MRRTAIGMRTSATTPTTRSARPGARAPSSTAGTWPPASSPPCSTTRAAACAIRRCTTTASKILFSYRKGGTEHYHLYEINADGTGLRQLTDGAYDDIEPTYLPDGDIVFVSTRCKRWVNCWLTQVAVLYRCDADGENIRPISSNNEHDNTPWPLPDGRLLYTRWEYVDRSQVHYHHLWVANPDGTAQMIWYGNLHPGIVMIDAKPIPGSDKVVASFSPGHGQREHAGEITIVDPNAGPDAQSFARPVSQGNHFRDPWAFSENCFMAAVGPTLVVMDDTGAQQEIFKLPQADRDAGHATARAPPAHRRARASASSPTASIPRQPTGRLVLADIYDGRNMAGVKRGEIKKLLVLETLPMPIHYTGGMEPDQLRRHLHPGAHRRHRAGRGGRLGLLRTARPAQLLLRRAGRERPVRQAHAELPDRAARRDDQLRRLPRAAHPHAPPSPPCRSPALRRPPSRIEPIAGVPEVIDFPRDIQPILDALCVSCHGYEKTAARRPARRAADPHRRPRPDVQPQLLHADHRPAVLRRPQPSPKATTPRARSAPPPAGS